MPFKSLARSSCFAASLLCPLSAVAEETSKPDAKTPATKNYGVVDCTLLIAPHLPAAWPAGMTQFVMSPNRTIGADAFNRDTIHIDEHTGTQWDAPAHFVPPPDSGLPGAGPMGLVTSEKVPVHQFAGEACVIDITKHRDDAQPGHSYLIPPEVVLEWEKEHRKLGPGDVVLFRSDYSDTYYKPLPEGNRLVVDVLRNKAPGWPGPTPQTMKLLGERGVWAAGIDSASMGPVPDLAVATHQAGGQYGLIWTELATNLGKLPTTGGIYMILPAFHKGGSGGEVRAVGITEPKLAADLLKRIKNKQVVDLSVMLDEDLPITWPGREAGEEAMRYLGKTLNAFSKARGPFFARGHSLDSQVGTHLVPPAYSLPSEGFKEQEYTPEVREALKSYEKQWGKRGTTDVTTDKVPLDQMMGPARVIDVSSLVGSTSEGQWPASPAITLEHVKKYEAEHGPIKAGDVVIFRSGYSNKHLKPMPEGAAMMADPLAGKSEGWPAPQLDVIDYLSKQGVACIGTDGPTLGSVRSDEALPLYWLAGSRNLAVIEFLTNLDKLPATGAFFVFAPVKISGSHGGYGRAIAIK